MGFMDELKKLTQPYEDEDDFFEGAERPARPAPAPKAAAQEQIDFDNAFGANPSAAPEPAQESTPARTGGESGGLFGALSSLGNRRTPRQPRTPRRERTVNFGGSDTQVILFNPKTFDEAGELVQHLLNKRSLVMTLEGLPTETARRLLDFQSGITFALQGKITPVSAKTYFISPDNVDLVPSQGEGDTEPKTESRYF